MDDFHEQTKFKDEPRKWHDMPWEAPELANLRELYMQGIVLRGICDRMQRPKEGVLPKLVQLGLIRRVADGYRYVYWRKVLPDAYKVSYPYVASAIDSIDAGIFKDSASGVTTCADLSELEMRAANATTTGRIVSPTPSLQTQPKEPIMKIETKVFINDQDASIYTDDQIFAEIRRAEKCIEELKAIKTPTKKLADNITKLEKYAADLATYVDSR